jgi:predicted enzyme related to lactoylglutathione lyase
MPRPIHFEIHAADPQRAIKFYTQLFGWTFTKWESPMDYWLIKTGEQGTPGIDGGLLPRRASISARRSLHSLRLAS